MNYSDADYRRGIERIDEFAGVIDLNRDFTGDRGNREYIVGSLERISTVSL